MRRWIYGVLMGVLMAVPAVAQDVGFRCGNLLEGCRAEATIDTSGRQWLGQPHAFITNHKITYTASGSPSTVSVVVAADDGSGASTLTTLTNTTTDEHSFSGSYRLVSTTVSWTGGTDVEIRVGYAGQPFLAIYGDGTGSSTEVAFFNTDGELAGDPDLTFDGTDLSIASGTAFDGTFAHAITAARTWTFPDLAGTVALQENNLGVFANTTSAQLSGVLSDETGTGAAVFANSPSLSGDLALDGDLDFTGPQSITTSSGALTLAPAAGSNLDVSLSTTGDFAVNTDDLYVDTSLGNVGIGTTGPGTKLEVDASAGGELARLTANDTGGGWITTYNDSTLRAYFGHNNTAGGGLVTGGIASAGVVRADAGLHLTAGVAATTGITVTNSGNVGIGTTTPTEFDLTVNGSIGSENDNTDTAGDATHRFSGVFTTSVDSGASDLTLNPNATVILAGDMDPDGDGTRDLGTQTTAQYANVWADLVNGADIAMANDWRMVESELIPGYGKGWALGFSTHWKDGKSLWAARDDDPELFDQMMADGYEFPLIVQAETVELLGVELTREELVAIKELVN